MIKEIIDQIKEADKLELAIIQSAWSRDGGNYPSSEWPIFWEAVKNRYFILNGDDISADPF